VKRTALHVTDPVARVLLVPTAVEVLGGEAELDDQHAREVEGDILTSFLASKPQQSLLVLAHDDPGVRAADEVHAIWLMWLFSKRNRRWLWLSARFLR